MWWPLPLLAAGRPARRPRHPVRPRPGRGVAARRLHPGGRPARSPAAARYRARRRGQPGARCRGRPEAPLIAIGGGLAAAAVRLARRERACAGTRGRAATGSFAAISALFGSPLAGAFLLMEAAGIGGPMLRPLLLPGLLASGIGSLVFIGLDAWTGPACSPSRCPTYRLRPARSSRSSPGRRHRAGGRGPRGGIRRTAVPLRRRWSDACRCRPAGRAGDRRAGDRLRADDRP